MLGCLSRARLRAVSGQLRHRKTPAVDPPEVGELNLVLLPLINQPIPPRIPFSIRKTNCAPRKWRRLGSMNIKRDDLMSRGPPPFLPNGAELSDFFSSRDETYTCIVDGGATATEMVGSDAPRHATRRTRCHQIRPYCVRSRFFPAKAVFLDRRLPPPTALHIRSLVP
jgi:hypothetical protein